MIGVYKITNTLDGKVYIGSTTIDTDWRWSTHLALLRRGKHHNRHLQRAWDKYGESAFSFEVVEQGTTQEDVREKERSWISKFFGKGCYNTSMEGAGRPTEVSRFAVRECVKKALENGITSVEKLEAYVQQSLGDSVRKDAIADVMRGLGYEQVTPWQKKGK
jgi:group I intron endonuclease